MQATRSSRSRTGASTRTRASTCAASRALSSQDVVTQRAAQGGSTIAQQFVKNALEAQGKRTVFEKLREAALAYHLTRKWSKEKILTEYLNSVYFGNGAYGIESAARTYFGNEPNHQGCGTPPGARAPRSSRPSEAALLAGDRRRRRAPTTRSRTRTPPRAGATSCSQRCSTQKPHHAGAVPRRLAARRCP